MRKQRLFVVIFSLAVSLGPAVFILLYSPLPSIQASSTTAAAPLLQETPPRKIDAALMAGLDGATAGQTFRFIVHLAGSADLAPSSLPTARVQRGAAVVDRLQQSAAANQAGLLDRLAVLQTNGLVATYRPLWIINAVAATGTAEAIAELAARPDVERVTLDGQRRYFQPPTGLLRLALAPQLVTATAGAASWGIDRVRAAHVWHGLGLDGAGITVAIVDTGVDWLHPDLVANYRGNLGNGSVQHAGHWYHAAYPDALTPVDALGHGTHVAGTAVGQNGIGVAPGARWIAVAIADDNGLIFDSQVHTAFEWLLAPAGDPALAPDIVNNSWGGPGELTTFIEDITAVQAAGMITVFAAGNDGPESGSVAAPASYPQTLAVGASDDLDAVAWFSARGPSPLTSELKPLLLAPGAQVLSALPGGGYGTSNGTSMATPHVAGAVALLLSADPGLSRPAITGLLAATAVPLGSLHPNNDSGWGRLDAYAAASQVAAHGTLQGTVTTNGVPLPGVALTVTTATGQQLAYRSDAAGHYHAWLQPGTYTLAAAAFAYAPVTVNNIAIGAGQTAIRSLNLAPLPAGAIQGLVADAATGAALPGATVAVIGAPVTATADGVGHYHLSLPAGQYDLVARAPGHRLGRATVTPAAGQVINQDFSLASGPAVLLVDSGQWYYQSYAGYYEDSLLALNYAHDRWSVRNPYDDVPGLADLAGYDAVIWSSPLDSPGYISANNVITDYLGLGGNLFISGQNVGAYDGYGFGSQIWWYRDLAASFEGKTTVTQTISGAPGTHFQGLALTLNGGSSAGNQDAIDVVEVRPNALTSAAFTYADGAVAGLQAGDCRPFHIVYLAYGLEGVSSAADRHAIVGRAFDTFASPRRTTGARWLPQAIDDFAIPGRRLVYTVTLQNLSETVTDTFNLELSGSDWASTLVTPTLTLGPCQAAETALIVDVPATAPMDTFHQMQLTALSANTQSNLAQLNLQHKTPGVILFVDDDRWYDREVALTAALDTMGLDYDVWRVGWNEEVRGSPPAHLLNAYDFIVWHTGYDWFRPVTAAENAALVTYLSQGGRLILSSQDFLYYHHDSPLARDFLGVLDYRESITPTQVYGGPHPAVPGALAGPLPLDYGQYQNFSDGLIAAPGSQPFWWHDQGMAAAVASASPSWRSLLLGIPFETLSPASQAIAMNSAMGWLSDLGDSTFTAGRRTISAGQPLTYTLALRNVAKGVPVQVAITNTLPAGLTLVPGSLSGGAIYDRAAHRITWQGTLERDSSHAISYQVRAAGALAAGARLDNPVTIQYRRRDKPLHTLAFTRTATLWIDAPDLTGSTLAAVAGERQPAGVVTYTLSLRNHGLAGARSATAEVRLPDELTPITDTLQTSAGLVTLAEQRISWEGHLRPGDAVTVSLSLDYKLLPRILWLPATAVIDDGVTATWLEDSLLTLVPYVSYFPIIAQK